MLGRVVNSGLSVRKEDDQGAALSINHHKGVEGLTADAVADAHRKDVEIQKEYGVAYHRYWFNEDTGEVFCLVEARTKRRLKQFTERPTGFWLTR